MTNLIVPTPPVQQERLSDERLQELLDICERASNGSWTATKTEENEPSSPDIWSIHADDTSYEATLAELWSGEHDNEANCCFITAASAFFARVIRELQQSRRAADYKTGSRKSSPTRDEMVEARKAVIEECVRAGDKKAKEISIGGLQYLFSPTWSACEVVRAIRALSSHSTDQDDGEKI